MIREISPSIAGEKSENAAEAELSRVLEAYLADLEAGRAVDRQRLLAAHPAIAGELRPCLDVMHLAGRVAHDSVPGAITDQTAHPVVPFSDYRIVRQVGRGGMGIVYEAEQQSLRRRVALKVLPLAAAIDPRQLRRFQVEAQAAAQLHHTHIVPVYATGCERGMHYYAMQYIEGKTLADLIRELRQLEGREPTDQIPTVTLELVTLLTEGPLGADPKTPASDRVVVSPEGRSAAPTPRPAASRSRASRSSAYFRTVTNLAIQAAEASTTHIGRGSFTVISSRPT